jgi:hypothetical protein
MIEPAAVHNLHFLTNEMINLINDNIKFNIDSINIEGPLELYFQPFTLRITHSKNIEIDVNDKKFLEKLQGECNKFPYPGLVIDDSSKIDLSKIQLKAYNSYIREAFGILKSFDRTLYEKLPDTFSIVGLSKVPAHIYDAICSKTHLGNGYQHLEKWYYRVCPNGGVARFLNL